MRRIRQASDPLSMKKVVFYGHTRNKENDEELAVQYGNDAAFLKRNRVERAKA